jgi:hypothetical protein
MNVSLKIIGNTTKNRSVHHVIMQNSASRGKIRITIWDRRVVRGSTPGSIILSGLESRWIFTLRAKSPLSKSKSWRDGVFALSLSRSHSKAHTHLLQQRESKFGKWCSKQACAITIDSLLCLPGVCALARWPRRHTHYTYKARRRRQYIHTHHAAHSQFERLSPGMSQIQHNTPLWLRAR